MSEKQAPLDLVVDNYNFNLIIRKVVDTRKDVGDGRTFEYSEITHETGDNQIKVLGRHYPLENVLKMANSSCKLCWSKGYNFVKILKSKYPNPNLFLIDEASLPKDLTEEEQKRWREEEQNKPYWRIMQICGCAVKRAHKKNPALLSNSEHNIWMTLDYEITSLPAEETSESVTEESK